MEDGGRARAEKDVEKSIEQTALRAQNANGQAYRSGENLSKPTTPDESIRAPVSGYIGQPPAPRRCVAHQLQTPPNTLVDKKKERLLSWELNHESHKKAKCLDNDGTLEGAMVPISEWPLVHNESPTAQPAQASCYDADASKIEESSLVGEPVSSPNCSNNARADELNTSYYGSNSTHCDRISPFGGTAGKPRRNCQVLIASDTKGDGNASTILSNNSSGEDIVAGNERYPQLPVRTDSGCASFDEVVPNDRSTTADLPTTTSEHLSPALDCIALDTSIQYDDFPDDAAVFEDISATAPRTEPRLCDEQLALVELIMNGKNVFYTGSAGCGKSTVLKHFVNRLKSTKKRVDILAPTGRAALEVNGRTIHNYAGWVPSSLGQSLGSLERNARGTKVQKSLGATDVLIIDEISMVANHVFERLNRIMKSARHSDQPFGGVQVIVTGDFCQLPPVKGFEYCLNCGSTLAPVSWDGKFICDKVECLAQFEEIDKWAFRSAAWQECNFEHVNLKVVHRQKDADLKALLEKRRLGLPYSVDEKWLLLTHESDTTDAVKLFPKKTDVRVINDTKLAQLPGRALTYCCVDDFLWNAKHDNLRYKGERCEEPMGHALEALEEHSLEPKLVLKEAMLVMLVVNWDLDSGLANGSQGTIVGFEKHHLDFFPEVPRKWDYSMYRNKLMRSFVERTAVKEWPIVQFLNGWRRTIYPKCMINELGDDEPYSLLSRTQIPLTAAWAMTVHKAQGMTLSRVNVDLRHTFEPGQDYVALSRAETLRGLKVEGLPRLDAGPDPQVIEFLETKNLMPALV